MVEELGGRPVDELRYPIFRLGALSEVRDLCNRSRLSRACRIAVHATGAGAVAAAVADAPEGGRFNVLASCFAVVDMGDVSGSTITMGSAEWKVEAADFEKAFAEAPRDDVVVGNRRDIGGPSLPAPMGAGRRLIGCFTDAANGRLIYVMFDGLDDDRSERLARALVPAFVDCVQHSWKPEPDWVRELKPPARRVLELVLLGYDDRQVAEQSGMTYHAVRAHLKRLFKTANVRSRLHLMQVCRESDALALLS